MPRKAPAFWQEDGVLPALLSPLSCLYLAGHKIKWAIAKPYKASIPVLCVGGITAGGSGKTPTIHALLSMIKKYDLFKNPVVLLRGYGGQIMDPTIVDLAKHTYEDVGDEALLHAQRTTTIISANRADGARLAEKYGADIILMDDGLQNNTLEKTISLLVIDGDQGLGNGRVIPAGPLREPFNDVLPRIAAIVQIGHDFFPGAGTRSLRATILPQRAPEMGKSYLAFAGLGHPEKFRRTLEAQGLTLADFIPFPDHYPYNEADIVSLKALAGINGIITTEKDYVRIPVHLREGIETLPITLSFEQEHEMVDMLKAIK